MPIARLIRTVLGLDRTGSGDDEADAQADSDTGSAAGTGSTDVTVEHDPDEVASEDATAGEAETVATDEAETDETAAAETFRTQLKIVSRDARQETRELSGGNQQKVVLAKWLQTDPTLLILDEPTRGIDIGAKQEVHHLMNELSKQGKGILLISSDLPEILGMSDRIIVLCEGRVTGRFSRAEATPEIIMAAAIGHKEAAK